MQIQDFFDTLTITDDEEIYVVTNDQLETAEHFLGWPLPEDYKHFCSHIGTCTTVRDINLFAMDDMLLRCSEEVKKGCSEEITAALEKFSKQDDENFLVREVGIENLRCLESSIFFAVASPGDWFFMNLDRSIENIDDCDIYLYEVYYPMKKANRVAKGFTDFVCNFCYGQSINNGFPQWPDVSEAPRTYSLEAIIPFYYKEDTDNAKYGIAGNYS
jgi:SMI1 / KNR4 family (SUKH-1)